MIERHDESAYLGGLVGLERLEHLRLLAADRQETGRQMVSSLHIFIISSRRHQFNQKTESSIAWITYS